jgi:hypothetical protein
MKLKKLSFLFLIFTVVLFIAACSEDKKTNNDNQFDGPEWNVDPVEIPEHMTQSQDMHAHMAVTYVGLANSFSAYGGLFAPPARALCSVNRDGEWTYTWSDGLLTVTLNITETSTHYYWKIYFDGTQGNVTYNDFLYIEAEQTIDGNSGSMTLYDPELTELSCFWQWNWDANEVFHFTFEVPNEAKILIDVNPDGSGFLEYHIYGTAGYWRNLRIEWTAAGTGEWWEYDEAGNIIANGTWT